MNVKEIVDELERGKRVIIQAEDAFGFMEECVRHKISISGIHMKFQHGRCAMRISKADRPNQTTNVDATDKE